MKYTIHEVLAGAYKGKGKRLDDTLTHASIDGGQTALCARVKENHLCDEYKTRITCNHCIRAMIKGGHSLDLDAHKAAVASERVHKQMFDKGDE